MTGPDRIIAYNELQTGYSFTAFGPQPHFGPVEYVRADLFDAKVQQVKELQGLLAAQKAKQEIFEGYLKRCHDALIQIVETAEDAI